MKKIEAIIKPFKLEEVKNALGEIGDPRAEEPLVALLRDLGLRRQHGDEVDGALLHRRRDLRARGGIGDHHPSARRPPPHSGCPRAECRSSARSSKAARVPTLR